MQYSNFSCSIILLIFTILLKKRNVCYLSPRSTVPADEVEDSQDAEMPQLEPEPPVSPAKENGLPPLSPPALQAPEESSHEQESPVRSSSKKKRGRPSKKSHHRKGKSSRSSRVKVRPCSTLFYHMSLCQGV